GFIIEGPQEVRGGEVRSDGNHRIAMSMAVAALWSREPITIHDTACIATSFPTFVAILRTIAPNAA
ncbi:MAG: 3-phosphoshikimate 1-carboxyvinyltransferase, partial [Phycisphaerae bacterium]